MIRPSHGSPTAGTGDGKGLFDSVALQHEVGEVVCGSGAVDTGKAIYEAAVAAQKVPRA